MKNLILVLSNKIFVLSNKILVLFDKRYRGTEFFIISPCLRVSVFTKILNAVAKPRPPWDGGAASVELGD